MSRRAFAKRAKAVYDRCMIARYVICCVIRGRRKLTWLAAILAFVPAGRTRATPLVIDLNAGEFHHVKFSQLKPTAYVDDGTGVLKASVARSSSFLMRGFDQVIAVHAVSYSWRSVGELHLADQATERSKAGDDGRLKVGLLLAGKAPLIPFFAPAWVKKVAGMLKQPSDHALLLASGTVAPSGTRWRDPYTDSIEYLAVASRSGTDGWQEAHVTFSRPLAVVGLWIMADGDDTGSSFTTWLRHLVLE